MDKIDEYMERHGIIDIISSYRLHLIMDIKRHQWWLACIGRRPTVKYAGRERVNLQTFEDAIADLGDKEWIRKELELLFKIDPDTDWYSKPPHLMVSLTGTGYIYVDIDLRKIQDHEGNYLRDDNGKALKKSKLDNDQIELVERLRVDCFCYPSRSGDGYHGWMKGTDKTCAIDSKTMNTKDGLGGYKAPCEVKEHACFLPPIINPANERTKIETAPDYVEEVCVRNARMPDKGKGEAVTPSEPHSCVPTLLAQYRALHSKNVQVVPASRDDFGGWHKRLTTLGVPKDKILEIAMVYPDYIAGKDDKDIYASEPYPDVEMQASIEMGRVRDLFAEKSIAMSLPRKESGDTQTPAIEPLHDDTEHKIFGESIGEVPTTTEQEPVHEFLVAPGQVFLVSGDPGHGKSTLVWWLMKEITDKGKVVVHIFDDQERGQVAARMREVGCHHKRAIIINLNKYYSSGMPVSLSRDNLATTIRHAVKAQGLHVEDIACICLDPAIEIVEKLWDDLALRYKLMRGRGGRGGPTPYDERDRRCAVAASDGIFRWLAVEFNCAVGAIDQPPKNRDGRHRFPGHVKYEARADLVIRVWQLTSLSYGDMPTSIRNIFKKLPKPFSVRLVTVPKRRGKYESERVFWTQVLRAEDGSIARVEMHKIDDTFALDPETDEKLPEEHKYLNDVLTFLNENVGQKYPVSALNKAVRHRNASANWCLGILCKAACKSSVNIVMVESRGHAMFYARKSVSGRYGGGIRDGES